MINIDAKQKIWSEFQLNVWENKIFKIWWRGLLFIPNVPAGKESVKIFAQEIEVKGIEKACPMLYGSFYCFVYNKELGTYYAFTDNSRQSCLFYDDKKSLVSSSFLNLIRLSHLRVEDMLPISVVEFLLSGFVFTKEIFFKNIKIIEPEEIIVFAKDKSKMVIKKKKLKNIFFTSKQSTKPETFCKEFQKIANSLKKENISIDLTGGTDTRILMVMFHSLGIDFETAISGIPNYLDVLISEYVAKKRNLNHFITYHNINSETLKKELKKAFYLEDGLSDILVNHRLYQFQKDKKKRKIDLSISGSGGELYKDSLYWKIALRKRNKKMIINNLVNSGLIGWRLLKGKIPKNLFSEKFLNLAINYKRSLSEKIYNLFAVNSQQDFYKMVDQIFYEYTIRAPRGFNQRLIINYMPLLERNIVKLGINIPKRERLFYIFYRRIVTSLDSEIAKIKTTRHNSTMIFRINYIIKDVLRMIVANLFKSSFKKKVSGPDNHEIYCLIRSLAETKELFRLLKDRGIINKDLKLINIDNQFLGRLVSLGKLIKYIDENRKT